MKYWLMKSEPDEFSIDDLQRVKVEPWCGIRNYQARNFIRDELQIGDAILFYHSSCKTPGVVGTARVVGEAKADTTAWDPESPRWFQLDIGFERQFARTVSLKEVKADSQLEHMYLVQKGARLSVQPVTEQEWQRILLLAGEKL
ncbi:EVE domain-containing protein [Shewanella algae]|uniref:EVE domain-containing protein n=1 Tax=Shewanella algae TaxID=38313 RepID=UPI001AAF863D|nr:EVE domain-containing protein [Shewanella algae]MBO2629152.1 EVE domain-containing protein [Shewanella algae]